MYLTEATENLYPGVGLGEVITKILPLLVDLSDKNEISEGYGQIIQETISHTLFRSYRVKSDIYLYSLHSR